ncbi:AAA family ATPase [bacterium]|nr:AAA family ATPase [bacterium]
MNSNTNLNLEDGNLNKANSLIISIISNKGGVGKTSIAICCGIYFAHRQNKKTLVVELDSSPGDFGPLFDINNDNSLDIAIKFPDRFKNYVKNIYKNLDVLKGFSNPINAESIKEIEIQTLFHLMSEFYDVIIIDTQTVLNGTIIDALKISDNIILVSESTIESLSRISELISILNNKFLIDKNKFQLIVNKKRFFDLFKVKDISKILDFPVKGFISFDKKFNKNLIIFNQNSFIRSKLNIEVGNLINNFISSGVINEFAGKA